MIVSHWVAFDLNTRESDVKDALNNNKNPVEDPCTETRICSLL